MKTGRSQPSHKNPRAAQRPRTPDNAQLDRQLQELMLEDEWNASWDEPAALDDRDYRTVDED